MCNCAIKAVGFSPSLRFTFNRQIVASAVAGVLKCWAGSAVAGVVQGMEAADGGRIQNVQESEGG